VSPLIKLIVGLAGTSLIALAAYKLSRAPLLSGLGSRSAEVMIANGITDGRANWLSPDGWTFRVARLSGTADTATRARTRDAIAALDGVHDALWEDGAAASVATAEPATMDLARCQARIDATIADAGIGFGGGDATITPSSLRPVDAVAQALQRCPDASADIVAHSAPGGNTAINRALAQARAEAVATALGERGIAGGRLTATSAAADGRGPRIDVMLRAAPNGPAPTRGENLQ
jgi:outer membrane protein OmpA-like peptidoglycan-associated protein